MQNQKNEKPKIQGEGDYEGARVYDEKTAAYAKSGKVDKAAKDAKKAVEGSERAELEEAEKKGKSRAKGEDPEVKP